MKLIPKLTGNDGLAAALVLLCFNPDRRYSAKEMLETCDVRPALLDEFLKDLEKEEFLESRIVKNDEEGNRFPKPTKVWCVKTNSPFYADLTMLCHKAAIPENKEIVAVLNKFLKVKHVILSGFFLGTDRKIVDILVVGDSRGGSAAGEKAIAALEKLIHRQLVYSVYSQEDFQYRYEMRDRHIREIMDTPYKVIFGEIEAI